MSRLSSEIAANLLRYIYFLPFFLTYLLYISIEAVFYSLFSYYVRDKKYKFAFCSRILKVGISH